MADKQNSRGKVEKLLEGKLDPNATAAYEICQTVTELVFKGYQVDASEPSK